MARNLIAGIDIGTYQIKVVVTEVHEENDHALPKIVGTGITEAKGLRHGYITNTSEVARSVAHAVSLAEKAAGARIKRAFVSVGGVGLAGIVSQSAIMISRADNEITELDVVKLQETCESEIPASLMMNRKVIYAIPIQYRIDGRPVLGKPLGMKGMRLESKMLFVTCLDPHLNDLIRSVEDAGIEVIDAMASPIAASFVTLSKTQKIAGCVLANLGAETTSIVVFENNIPISLEVFPIGSTDITNDIALGLKIPLDEAERIKLGAVTSTQYSKKKLDEIISARVSDIFDLIEDHLRKIGRSGLLPAGIILIGGGSGAGAIEELAKNTLKLPSTVGTVTFADEKRLRDSIWAVAYGLCIWGFRSDTSDGISTLRIITRGIGGKIFGWFKQFLP